MNKYACVLGKVDKESANSLWQCLNSPYTLQIMLMQSLSLCLDDIVIIAYTIPAQLRFC